MISFLAPRDHVLWEKRLFKEGGVERERGRITDTVTIIIVSDFVTEVQVTTFIIAVCCNYEIICKVKLAQICCFYRLCISTRCRHE